MVNKIVSLNEMIVHLGPPVWRCRGPLYKVVWQPVFTTALTASSIPQFLPQLLLDPNSTRGCYHKVGQMEIEDVRVGLGQVGVQDTRVGQVVPPIQPRRGPRSQITLGEEIT